MQIFDLAIGFYSALIYSRAEKTYVRNALNCADFSKSSAQKPYIKNELKYAEMR